MYLKLTEAEYRFVTDTLDEAREELDELIREEEWYATEVNEKCLAAYNIMKHADRLNEE